MLSANIPNVTQMYAEGMRRSEVGICVSKLAVSFHLSEGRFIDAQFSSLGQR